MQHEMLFQKRAKQSDKAAEALSETCEEQPFTMLLKFLGMEPSQRVRKCIEFSLETQNMVLAPE